MGALLDKWNKAFKGLRGLVIQPYTEAPMGDPECFLDWCEGIPDLPEV